MSAPLLWILLPLMFSACLLGVARWRRVSATVGSALALVLASLALFIPVGRLIQWGLLTFEIQPSWFIFGRRFSLIDSDRPLIVLINLALTFWFIGSLATNTHPLFIPLGMALSIVLIAAIFIQPLYYGAILLLLAAMITVVLFVSEEREASQGLKRFWIFQSLAMPFLLLAGWLISGTEANPGEINSAALIFLLLLLGFSLLLGTVPFQSWLPALAERISPYVFSCGFFVTSFLSLLFVLRLLLQYPWLSSSSWFVLFFSFQGFLMTVVGGIGAVYHRHLGRLLGYALLKEIGMSFLIVGLGLVAADQRSLYAILFMQMLPRGIALALLALACNLFRERAGSLHLQELSGLGRILPLATLAFFVAMLTLVGFPLTAAFPVHLVVWQGWFEQFPLIAIGAVSGSVGVLIGGMRALAVLARSVDDRPWAVTEAHPQLILLAIASAILLLSGVLPQWFLPLMYQWGLTFLGGR